MLCKDIDIYIEHVELNFNYFLTGSIQGCLLNCYKQLPKQNILNSQLQKQILKQNT